MWKWLMCAVQDLMRDDVQTEVLFQDVLEILYSCGAANVCGQAGYF